MENNYLYGLAGIMECTPLECENDRKFTTNVLALSFCIHADVYYKALPEWMQVLWEGLNKLQNSFSRHTKGRVRTSGVGQNQVKTIVYSALSGKLVPDDFTRICPIFVLSRSTSCILAVVDAGFHQHDDKDT